jgi:PKD repeat protein
MKAGFDRFFRFFNIEKQIEKYLFLIVILFCAINSPAKSNVDQRSPQLRNSADKILQSKSIAPNLDDSRVRWRFQMAGQYSFVRPAIGPSGTIYAVDVAFNLYALSPDGALLWRYQGAGNKGVAVGADETIYTASENDIKAFNPNGTLKWQFNLNPRAFITLGVAVGPDGNIYSVAYESLGVFSLTPQGALRWSTPEPYMRPIVEYGEIVFGQNGKQQQLYFYANGRIRAVRLSDGATVFPTGEMVQPFGQPAVSPLDNTVHANVTAYTPNGNLLWSLFPIYPSSIGFPAADVGTDGIHYVTYPPTRLYAINPNGSVKYQADLIEPYGSPIVSPDNQILVMSSSVISNINSIVGFKASDGSENWRVQLPLENNLFQFSTTRARFTPDGQTAYVHTATADGSTGRSFLYAVDARPNTGNLDPHAAASADRTAGRAPITIRFSSNGSFDRDGAIASYLWDFADGTTSTEANPTHIYQLPGDYRVKLTVTDNLGATNVTYLSIGLLSGGCTANCARVTEIRLMANRLPGKLKITGYVRVQDENGAPVANATVKVGWGIPMLPVFQQSAVTNSDGYATFAVSGKKGTYTLSVDLVVASGLTFDDGNSLRFATITR